jgi:hypothetical protein
MAKSSPKVVAPIMAKGGKQPCAISHGKSRLPMIAPVLPNIMTRETFIVLWFWNSVNFPTCSFNFYIYLVEVGNIDTTEPTSVVDDILDTEMYPDDSRSVVSVSFAQ